MPTIGEEILLMLGDGLFIFLNIRALFQYGQHDPSAFYKAVRRLETRELVKRTSREKTIYLRLTEKGRSFVRKHREQTVHCARLWDRKWRLVVFDIPEKRGEARYYLRNYLATLGFGMVQKSVWISPYDREPQVDTFARKLDLGQYVFQVTATDFKGMNELEMARRFWDLPRLHTQYLRLIEKYSSLLPTLRGNSAESNESPSIGRNRFINNLLWDYQSILNRDPQLPFELLPADWSGEAAKQFVKSCLTLLPSIPN